MKCDPYDAEHAGVAVAKPLVILITLDIGLSGLIAQLQPPAVYRGFLPRSFVIEKVCRKILSEI